MCPIYTKDLIYSQVYNYSLGKGYNYEPTESDILLLDISNNTEYIWTNTFGPMAASPPSSTISPSSTSSHSATTSSVIIGSIVGSIIFGFLLAVICFLLYKWNKNKQTRKNMIPNPGNEEVNNNRENLNLIKSTDRNYNQGAENISPNLLSINEQEKLKIHENVNETNHEPIYNNHGQQEAISMANNEGTTLQKSINETNNEPIYNHGQEAVSITNDERTTLQNIDDDVLQKLIKTLSQEAKLRQESLQNNGQASTSNIARNNNSNK